MSLSVGHDHIMRRSGLVLFYCRRVPSATFGCQGGDAGSAIVATRDAKSDLKLSAMICKGVARKVIIVVIISKNRHSWKGSWSLGVRCSVPRIRHLGRCRRADLCCSQRWH